MSLDGIEYCINSQALTNIARKNCWSISYSEKNFKLIADLVYQNDSIRIFYDENKTKNLEISNYINTGLFNIAEIDMKKSNLEVIF